MKVAIAQSDYNDPQNTTYTLIIIVLYYFLNIHLLAVVNITVQLILLGIHHLHNL